MAASGGHARLVALLLQHGADPYVCDWHGNALHCAAHADQPESTLELIGFGMPPDNCDEYRRRGAQKSPILCTLDGDSVSALQALTSLGATVNVIPDCCEQPFLHEAADVGASKIVEHIVSSGLVDVNSKPRTGETALDCAIGSQDTETIHTLLRVGADARQISSVSSAKLAQLGLCSCDLKAIEPDTCC